MKVTTTACLISALAMGSLAKVQLQDRQEDVTGATTADADQYPSVTTNWLPVGTTIDGVYSTTYLAFPYTQTFAAVPDQGPSPGVGTIGLGTLTAKKAKRAEETGIAGRVMI